MAQDTFLVAESITSLGKLKSGQGKLSTEGAAGTLTAVGVVVTNLNSANQFGGITGGSAGASCTTGGTISSATRTSKVTTGSAVTGILIGSGTQDGQELTVVHVGAAASSITFSTAGSAAGSSHVATEIGRASCRERV